MKVVHIGHAPLLPGHPNFESIQCHPGSWVVNLCKAQSQAGMNVELVMHVPGASRYHQDDSQGFPIHYIPGPYRLRAATFFHFDKLRISTFVRTLDPDIVHAHGTEEAYLLAAQMTGKPYVVTAQGMYSQINRALPPKLVSRARVVEFLERSALARAQHIVAKSEYVADWIRQTYPHLTIHQIPNTFDPRLLDRPANIPKESGSIAFVGTVEARKGLHILFEALKKSTGRDQLSLHVFGNRGHDANDYERSTIGNLRSLLGGRLHLHGIIPAADLPAKVSRCELLVAPSLEEMFGNQVIEALLVGTWPIVSSGTAMAENVNRIEAGTVFKNQDAFDFAREIQKAQVKIKVWNREETRLRVDHWLGPSKVAGMHLSLYCRILDERV